MQRNGQGPCLDRTGAPNDPQNLAHRRRLRRDLPGRLFREGLARSHGGVRPQPGPAAAPCQPAPRGGRARCRRLAGGRGAQGASGLRGHPLRPGPGPSALAVRAAERRRAGRGERRAAQHRRQDQYRRPGLGSEDADGEGPLHRSQRQQDHPAAGRRRRRGRGDPHHLRPGSQVPVRHDPGGRNPLCGQYRRRGQLPVQERRHPGRGRRDQGV